MNSITKVCHVLTLPQWGGTENRLYNFICHSKEARLKHHVIATSGTKAVIEAFRETGVPVFVPPRQFHYDPRAIWHMACQMRKWKIDIVHTQGWVGNCWGGIAARIARIQHVISSERGDIFLESNRFRTRFETWIHRTNDFVLTNSYAANRMLVLTRGLPEEHIRVIYSGVDISSSDNSTELRAELGIAPGKPVIGTVGRLHSQKDQFTFLRAARLIHEKRPDVVFVIVGGGALENELRRQISQNNLDNTILLVGWRRDIPAFLDLFDVFVFTSVWESLPGAVIEASFAGKPIVAPAVCGIPELVIDNETGILLVPTEIPPLPDVPEVVPLPRQVLIDGELSPPRSLNPQLLADKAIYLLEHPNERLRLGQNAREYVKKKFSLEGYIDNTEKIYLDLIPNSH